MQHYELKHFPDANALAQAAAETWLRTFGTDTAPAQTLTIALSGGRIATPFYQSIVKLASDRGAQLGHIHFFWADERCVPPTDPESNYRLAQDQLFAPLQVPAANIHRVPGELPPAQAAGQANFELTKFAPSNPAGLPILDLVILGLGEDGHVASLFPGATPATDENRSAYVAINESPKPPPNRVTLTYDALAAARQLWVLASGQGKAEALRNSLSPNGSTPLARVLRARQHSLILSDIPPC